MVLVVSKGYDGDKKTAVMRHGIGVVAAKSYQKIELVQEEVLSLNNEFFVTFYAEGKLFERRFLFPRNSIYQQAFKPIPLIGKEGILAIW